MSNPKHALALALYDTLNGRVVDAGGVAVPVFTNVPNTYTGGAYVFISQFTATEQTNTPICRGESGKRWRATVLIDCIVPFQVQGQADLAPGMLLTEQVQTLVRSLLYQTLSTDYTVETLAVELTNGFGESAGDAYYLHDPTRFAFTIKANPTVFQRAARITTTNEYRITASGKLRVI